MKTFEGLVKVLMMGAKRNILIITGKKDYLLMKYMNH